MKDRVLSGVTLVAFFMAIVVFNRSFPLALNIAIAFISALAVFEVIKALELSDRWYIDRKSTRLNSSHNNQTRMPSSA